MNTERPETLAVRAVNQYRRRDVFAYLGLRYFLSNRCAVRDRWASDVAAHLVMSRSDHPYCHVLQFKEWRAAGGVEHRDIHLPGPNEALVEAVVLRGCADAGIGVEFPDNVFSYRLARGKDRLGVFQHYFGGFRARHHAIAKGCLANRRSVVLYTDIRRFYPSISSELALRVWRTESERAGLDPRLRTLGERILHEHRLVQFPRCAGLLTGPMLSHLMGNLVLKTVDRAMSERLPGGYFRYVDDIVLVGSDHAVTDARQHLSRLLNDLGLELHSTGKDFTVKATEWLEGIDDFQDDLQRPSWMTLVGSLKHLLVTHPGQRDSLIGALQSVGGRLPVPDYSQAAWEATALESFLDLRKRLWFRIKVGRITAGDLVRQALILRQRHSDALRALADGAVELTGYQRKRRVSKLRYHAGRLVYLAAPDQLVPLARLLESLPELRFHCEILRSIGRADVSELLSFGTNAVQSAAQALRMSPSIVQCNPAQWGPAERQGFAVLLFNGIAVTAETPDAVAKDELVQFARWGDHGPTLMRSSDPFIRELACLHGCVASPRHNAILDSAFDRDEELAFDAITQERPYS